MEVVRPDLILYFTLLTLFSCLLTEILKPIWNILCRPTLEENDTRREVQSLRTEQKKLSLKDDFVAYSKLQRKINNLEDKLKDMSSTRSGKNLKFKYIVNFVLQSILAVIILIATLSFRNVPLIIFDQKMFPFERFFSYPSDVPNSIVAHPWVIVSRVSLSAVLTACTKLSHRKTIDTVSDVLKQKY